MLSKLFGGSQKAAPGTIGYAELKAALAAGECALVDVREPGEFAGGHVAGAINMPLSRFDVAALPAGKVVLICLSGGRSARALSIAHAGGRGDIVHFSGGVTGWRAAGGSLTA